MALKQCKQLPENKPSHTVSSAIQWLCGYNQKGLKILSQKYSERTERATDHLIVYAASIDNWEIPLYPFGLADHCVLLYYLLNLHKPPADRLLFRDRLTNETIRGMLNQGFEGHF